MYKTFHLSRAQRNAWAADNPVGDPFGGPAYGEKTDIGSVVGSVVGGIFGSDAAGDAADAQMQSANTASQTQLQMFNQSRQDQEPWRQAGVAGLNKLSTLLGLSPDMSGQYSQTAEQIRNELLPAFTTGTSGGYNPASGMYGSPLNVFAGQDGSLMYAPGQTKTIDEAGLSAAIQKRMAEQKTAMEAQRTANKSDPAYGSLLRRFSAADLNADPVYQSGLQFGLNEGVKGINRQAAAGGNFLSGATLKALTRFGNDYGSTKANEAYNRYTNDQTNTYNKLAGISGTGQTAANQIATQGISTGNNIAGNQLAAGNARASGYINQGSAMQGMLGGIYGAYRRGSPGTPDYSSYQPESYGPLGSFAQNPFQMNDW